MYAITAFTGAFLLFELQPIMGKYLLPLFGGGPAVWSTCLFFFQAFLLAGYAYAHGVTRHLQPRAQAFVHLLLLGAGLAFLPLAPAEAWAARTQDPPWKGIVLLLAANIGLPYLLLASTGPLIQRWYSCQRSTGGVYRLYAMSNLGSLLALLAYPILVEPHLSRRAQTQAWSWGLVLYCLCCAVCALKGFQAAAHQAPGMPQPGCETAQDADANIEPTGWQRLAWVLWPMCASVLLLAITNKLCLDVAVFPFLWIVPLAVYLLSFVICFDHPRWYKLGPYTVGLALVLPCFCWALYSGAVWPFAKQVIVYCASLLVCCLVCHGELFRLRPRPSKLTEFYLLVAVGGALGGLFVSLLAPVLFSSYCELNWGLAAFGAMVATAWTVRTRERKTPEISGNRFEWQPLALTVVWLGAVGLVAALWLQARRANPDIVHRSRNFYGVLTVFERRKDEPKGHHYLLQHGRITHGLQLADPELQLLPTTYYGPESGLGLALSSMTATNRRIGVVGLGAGTIATYARAGDSVQFYEIDPAVEAVAETVFQYLNRCAGSWRIIRGDARLSLQRQPPQQFDLLAIDAFSSDSIPVHLLTREAFATYLSHLKPNGVLAIHISNHFLDLEPVVRGLAAELHLTPTLIDHDADPQQWWIYSSTWVLMSRDNKFGELPAIATAAKHETGRPRTRLWTDDFCSPFQILR